MSNNVKVSEIHTIDEQLGDIPEGLSLFDPLIHHEVKEALESGDEVSLARDSAGSVTGLFIYDSYEDTGTIFTKSRDVFDYFYRLKPSSYIFSEFEATDIPREDWNIWQLDVDRASLSHRFRYHVSMESNVAELEGIMAITQPETNKKWVGVALKNGDKCFVVRIAGRIVGIAWMSIVGGVARSHGLYVEPQFRKKGVMTDNFHARLIYLKSRRVHTLINEIAESNVASSKLAEKEGEKIVGRMFLYFSPGPDSSS